MRKTNTKKLFNLLPTPFIVIVSSRAIAMDSTTLELWWQLLHPPSSLEHRRLPLWTHHPLPWSRGFKGGMSGILWICIHAKMGRFFRFFFISIRIVSKTNTSKSPPKILRALSVQWIQISHLQVSGIKIIPKYSPITSHVPHFPPCQASRPSKPRSKIPQEVLETTRPERQRGCLYHDIKQHQVRTLFFGTSFYRTWRPEETDQIHGLLFCSKP